MLYKRVIRPAIFALTPDPERAHNATLCALRFVSNIPPLTWALERIASAIAPLPPSPPPEVFGLVFPNRIGLAAGYDKNAVAVPALAALGFGFIEVGTVTMQEQSGNPGRRIFRLEGDEALINRMGFNNEGVDKVAGHLSKLRRKQLRVPVGISMGKSMKTPVEDALGDYLGLLDRLHPFGDYFVINVSSPNTPRLRTLQEPKHLDILVTALVGQLHALATTQGQLPPKPLLLKVAPDLEVADLDAVLDVCMNRGVSGVIVANTTISRDGLRDGDKALQAIYGQSGGMSGRPLYRKALSLVHHVHRYTQGTLPIIASGGVFTIDDAQSMLDAGASLVQVYTSLAYEGPFIARKLASAHPTPRAVSEMPAERQLPRDPACRVTLLN